MTNGQSALTGGGMPLLAKQLDECLEQLESTTIDIGWAEKRNPNVGKEIDLAELFDSPSSPAIYDYKEKLAYLEGANGQATHV